MENTNFDVEKVIKEMKILKEKRLLERKAMNEQHGIEEDEAMLSEQITIKYLGKMEFAVEGKEELVEKDVFMSVEEIDGQFQIRYYDENMQCLGIQRAMDKDIILSIDMIEKSPEEKRRIMEELEAKDKEQAKTVDELEEEEQSKSQENQQDPEKQDEKKKIEKTDDSQLNRTQVNRLKGPKVELNQIVDKDTLGDVIGLQGAYMQIIDADEAKKLIPDLQIPSSQRTVPIEIFSDGSANVIGENKLAYSTVEGNNSAQEYVTMKNEGTIRRAQNLETFNIASKGGMHTIAVGYDENGGMPLEAKYGRRDIEDPTKIAYSELETVHEGPLQQADNTQEYQEAATGVDKGQETLEKFVEEYAIAMNIRVVDEHGYPTSEYDLDAARKQLEEKWAENPDASLEEIIDEEQKQPGPEDNRRW